MGSYRRDLDKLNTGVHCHHRVLFLHEQLHSYHLLGGDITLLDVILSQCLPTSRGDSAQKYPPPGVFCKDQDNH